MSRAIRAFGIGFALVTLALLAAAGCKEDTKLKVTGIEPSKGDFNGGEPVVIKGNRFSKDGTRSVKVFFGGLQGTMTRFVGDDELHLLAPPGKAGTTVDVDLEFEPGGGIKLEKAFTYVEKSGPSMDDLQKKPK